MKAAGGPALAGIRYFFGRFLTGITNFNPDQTSVTAQTLMSTNPTPSPVSRTRFSLRSVTTPELFFGQAIQSIPAGARARAAAGMSSSKEARDLANRKMKSRFPLVTPRIRHFASECASSAFTSAGACIKATRNPSLIPSFLGSGVPEYPGIWALGFRLSALGSNLPLGFRTIGTRD